MGGGAAGCAGHAQQGTKGEGTVWAASSIMLLMPLSKQRPHVSHR